MLTVFVVLASLTVAVPVVVNLILGSNAEKSLTEMKDWLVANTTRSWPCYSSSSARRCSATASQPSPEPNLYATRPGWRPRIDAMGWRCAVVPQRSKPRRGRRRMPVVNGFLAETLGGTVNWPPRHRRSVRSEGRRLSTEPAGRIPCHPRNPHHHRRRAQQPLRRTRPTRRHPVQALRIRPAKPISTATRTAIVKKTAIVFATMGAARRGRHPSPPAELAEPSPGPGPGRHLNQESCRSPSAPSQLKTSKQRSTTTAPRPDPRRHCHSSTRSKQPSTT